MSIESNKRVILIVLDSVGCGELPDASDFGDQGSHTLRNMAKQVGGLKLPNLSKLGLGNLFAEDPIAGLEPVLNPKGFFGKMKEVSLGKDTSTGHFEMAGCIVEPKFPTFPEGFDHEWLMGICRSFGLDGYLGNGTASGTEIIERLGDEHVASGKPIIYTSADSVFQVAAHEETFGLQKLLEFCQHARKSTEKLNIARVIARPFLGTSGSYKRTSNRKDYAIAPWKPTMMDRLSAHKLPVVSVGKVANIYDHRSFSQEVPSKDNFEGINRTLEAMDQTLEGLIFCNLVDFDMHYGHRRDPKGYHNCLREFDDHLPRFINRMQPNDLLLIVSDHGNDPTYKGTDHTREYCLLLGYTRNEKPVSLGTRDSLADIGQTVVDYFRLPQLEAGKSFWEQIK